MLCSVFFSASSQLHQHFTALFHASASSRASSNQDDDDDDDIHVDSWLSGHHMPSTM
jgi:hypothetical protein